MTWTNSGPSTHTATASNGSFDTGQLKRGQSASHTFTQAGTFAYICQIHPFMHGTIVVVANPSPAPTPSGSATNPASAGGTSGGTPGASSAAGSASSATATSAAAANGQTLPLTGLDLTTTLIWAAALIGGGLAIRRSVLLRQARR